MLFKVSCAWSSNGDYVGSSVWLLSSQGEWLYLAPSLKSYLRLAVVHLGLQQWQLKLATDTTGHHLQVETLYLLILVFVEILSQSLGFLAAMVCTVSS